MLKISENATKTQDNPTQATVQWEFSCCAREYASFEFLVCRNLAEVSFPDISVNPGTAIYSKKYILFLALISK